MDILSIKTAGIKYRQQNVKLIIGQDLLSHLPDLCVVPGNTAGFIVLADKNVMGIHKGILPGFLEKFKKPVHVLEIRAEEKNKSFSQVGTILSLLLKKGVNRNYLFINLGGGIISDIGGFVASILFRGIPYLNIPTTLLSQVDAAIGGKTGVNFRIRNLLLKNMVGSINMPVAVLSDTDLLDTLPESEIKNGLGEMLKYSLISEKLAITDLINIKENFRNKTLVGNLIAKCQNIKLDLVLQDPFDQMGIREKLNLGHTIGHGIESASNGKYSHGQSVAAGLTAVTKISVTEGLLNPVTGENIINNIRNLGLPTTIGKLDRDLIISSIKLDKKNGTFVLIKDIGKILTGQTVGEKLIRKILKEIAI